MSENVYRFYVSEWIRQEFAVSWANRLNFRENIFLSTNFSSNYPSCHLIVYLIWASPHILPPNHIHQQCQQSVQSKRVIEYLKNVRMPTRAVNRSNNSFTRNFNLFRGNPTFYTQHTSTNKLNLFSSDVCLCSMCVWILPDFHFTCYLSSKC